jgi:hypothetical protein
MLDYMENTISKDFEFLTRVGAASLAFLYLCGFLVVSIHLSSYGVYSIALLRGQYLVAGVLSLGPLCLTVLIFARLHTSFEGFPVGLLHASGWSGTKQIFRLVFALLWEAITIFALCSFMIDGFASIFMPNVRDILPSHWRVFSWITAQSMLFIFFLMRTWQVSRGRSTHDSQGIRKTFQLAFLAACSILFFLVYLSYFARRLYSEIPFTIGGGKPQTVVFLTKQNDKQFTLLAEQSSGRSIPYELLLETDLAYTVLSDVATENAIQVNREAVAGYVILKDR